MRTMIIAIACLFVANLAAAQNPIEVYEMNFYLDGSTASSAVFTFTPAAVTCNQPDPGPTTGTVVNPSRISWDDVDNPGMVCLWNDPGTGPLLSMAGGSWEGTLRVTDTLGLTSPESNRAPFVVAGPPAARSGLRFSRP